MARSTISESSSRSMSVSPYASRLRGCGPSAWPLGRRPRLTNRTARVYHLCMTNLEHIIREATARATVTTVTRITEDIADEMARDILRDPAVRARFITLIQKAFDDTLTALNEPMTPPSS